MKIIYLRLPIVFSLILLGFVLSAHAALQGVGRITAVTKSKSNGVILDTSSRAKVLVEFVDQSVIRVRVSPSGKFERDFSYAIDYSQDRPAPAISVQENASTITLTNATGTKAVVSRSTFLIKVLDDNGRLLLQSDPSHPLGFDRTTGEIETTMLRPSEVETYYGFGEKAFPEMSRNGKFIVNWNTDTFSYPVGTDPVYQSIPYFTALYEGRAYGLFFNNTFRTWFDMGAKSPERYSFGANGGELDYFVFTGGKDRSPKNVLADYAGLTGKTPLPPIWALGNQQSRWSYFPESRVREIADGFRSRKIPLDVLYLDIDYMDGGRFFPYVESSEPHPLAKP